MRVRNLQMCQSPTGNRAATPAEVNSWGSPGGPKFRRSYWERVRWASLANQFGPRWANLQISEAILGASFTVAEDPGWPCSPKPLSKVFPSSSGARLEGTNYGNCWKNIGFPMVFCTSTVAHPGSSGGPSWPAGTSSWRIMVPTWVGKGD